MDGCEEVFLEEVRRFLSEVGEDFWALFSYAETRARKFFLSLPPEKSHFLMVVATAEALIGG